MCIFKDNNIKFASYAYSVIFLLTGTALATIGAIYSLTFSDLSKTIPESYISLTLIPILTIIVGCLIFVVAIYGCVTAFLERDTLHFIYGGLLLSIFLFQVGIGSFTFLEIKDRDDLSDNVNKTVDTIFRKNDTDMINSLQNDLRCCGTYGQNFYAEGHINTTIPMSCCKDFECLYIYEDGCQNAVFNLFVEVAKVSGLSLLAFSLTELTGAILALWYANELKKNTSYYRKALLLEE